MYWSLEAAEAFGALYAQRTARAQVRSQPRARALAHMPNALAISIMLHAAVLAWAVALVPMHTPVRTERAEPAVPVAIVFSTPRVECSESDSAALWAAREEQVVVEGEALPEVEPMREAAPSVESPSEPALPEAAARRSAATAEACPCVTADTLRIRTAHVSRPSPSAGGASGGGRDLVGSGAQGSGGMGAGLGTGGGSGYGSGTGSGLGSGSENGSNANPGSGAPVTGRPSARKGNTREVEAVAGNPRPDYPVLARRKGLEGLVIVCVNVLETGRPGDVKLARSSGHPSLDEAALACAKRWRFKPALRDGQAVRCEVEVPFQFELVTARR